MNGTPVNILNFSTNIVRSDQGLLKCLSASVYQGSVTNGIYKANRFGYARGAVIMSTQGETVFEWSVKLISRGSGFRVGIASQLQQDYRNIFDYDENAILYTTKHSGICIGSNKIHSEPGYKDGDVFDFRFQPQTKQFVVRLVRI